MSARSLDIWNTLSVGERMRTAREKLKLSQAEFALRFRFNATAISHWEVGRRDPSLENLVRLCHALEVEPNHLLRGSI